MSKVQEIEEAVVSLDESEQEEFAHWFVRWQKQAEEAADAWDKQIEEDIKAGRLDAIFAEGEADIAAGRTRPL